MMTKKSWQNKSDKINLSQLVLQLVFIPRDWSILGNIEVTASQARLNTAASGTVESAAPDTRSHPLSSRDFDYNAIHSRQNIIDSSENLRLICGLKLHAPKIWKPLSLPGLGSFHFGLNS